MSAFECRAGEVRIAFPQRGFTLIELMVGLLLSGIILFALVTLFGNNSRMRNEIDRATQQIENGRYALDLIRDDLHLAGYYGDVVPQSGFTTATAYVPTNADLCDTTAGTVLTSLHFNLSPLQWPVPVFGIAGGDTVPACVSGYPGVNFKAGTDILVVRRTSTLPTASGSLVAGQVYLQASGCNTELQQHKDFARGLGSPTSAFNLQKKGCAAASDIYPFQTRIYYVSNETIPTLRLITLSGTTLTNEPLVEGVDDMRVEYGLDSAGNDGSPETYRKCLATGASADPCSTAEWANMMAVRVYILARNSSATPEYTDTKTYNVGLSGTIPAFGDGYKRHLYSMVTRLMNPAGYRER
jgi:type IV pilus assembly protein PilW